MTFAEHLHKHSGSPRAFLHHQDNKTKSLQPCKLLCEAAQGDFELNVNDIHTHSEKANMLIISRYDDYHFKHVSLACWHWYLFITQSL